MGKERLHFKIYGRVQGVGFRYYIYLKAREIEIRGWVKNTSGGTVEGEVEGDRETLENFLEWAKRGPGWAKVERVEEKWEEAKNDFKDFKIKSV